MNSSFEVNIIGAGLAGSEMAWQLATRNIQVNLYEYRDENRKTFAHRTENLAELVCSNSLHSDEISTAIGLLHQEMRILNSLIMLSADANKVPAGSALAVDREGFSKFILEKLLATKKVKIIRTEISQIPFNSSQIWVVASGPLTTENLTSQILQQTKQENLAFFDAIAPIIFKDSINFDVAWFQSRYDKGEGADYINCPLNQEQYQNLVQEILNAKKIEFKEWEKNTPYFDGCLPIEEMARRGEDVLRFGPLKPVGLTNPHFPKSPALTKLKDRKEKPYAVVQLRQDNASGTIYNMVGFQTKMTYGEQQRIFRMIPSLENAEFARLGGIHRNCFINSPNLLDEFARFKSSPNIYFAGQITGVEGYVESASMGLITGIFIAHDLKNNLTNIQRPSNKTAIGSLLNHISPDSNQRIVTANNSYQPMNVNFGLFEPLPSEIKKDNRKDEYSKRALAEINNWKAKFA